VSSNMRGSEPLYRQVAGQIVVGIQAGTWLPGDKLPSEHALCDTYHVSQITVRRALRELAHQGRVYSRHGLGWYVDVPSAGGTAGIKPDVRIVTPALDDLVRATIAACVQRLTELHQVVDVLYVPEGGREELALPGDLADAPLVWAVAGDEQTLATRYTALAGGHRGQSILLGRSIEGLPLPAVKIDERAAMARVTEHLIALGYRRIGYVGTDPTQAGGWRRYQGFADSMWNHGLELPLDWVFSAGSGGWVANDQFSRVMAGSLRPTAIACSDDNLAVQAIHRLASVGLSCPSDVAVVGMGDEPFGAYIAEPLTTFRFDYPALATQVVEAVADLREGRQPHELSVTGELVVRTSCGARSGRIAPVTS
jgi:GntR family transcriptional regulator of arabinose operon